MTGRLVLATLASTLLFACGGDVGSPDDARAGWAKTSVALASGSAAAQSGGATYEEPVYRAGGAELTVNADAACSGGGTIHFAGTYTASADVGAQATFDYDTTFDGCEAQGLTIDGDLHYALAVESSGTSSSVVYSYKGDLEWSGDVKGSCTIDMSGSISVETGGTPGTGSASISYKGSICGYDASATLNVNVGG